MFLCLLSCDNHLHHHRLRRRQRRQQQLDIRLWLAYRQRLRLQVFAWLMPPNYQAQQKCLMQCKELLRLRTVRWSLILYRLTAKLRQRQQ
jgi:hypothetical protein